MTKWHCTKCGACCHLDPTDRPELDQYLPPEELQVYLSMVGDDGWCINYDHDLRECKIYDDRPRFCRVEVHSFVEMYGIEPEELDEFAIECCEQQISAVYGDRSPEMQEFLQLTNS
jgi:uncharacterized protein